MLTSIDLFSGIGCFSLAFHGVFKTVQYCEIDKRCREVLRKNMAKGLIDNAPIHNDVKTLFSTKAKVLTAGFPCQDLSQGNRNAQGLNGERSGLFYEIIRILRTNPSINHVFLENVPALMKFKPEVDRKLRLVGFESVKYTVVSASQVGAPHLRRRLFIYASRSTPKPRGLPQIPTPRDFWKSMPRPPLTTTSIEKIEANQRNKACGNCIVPACIQVAYNVLIHEVPPIVRHRPVQNVLKQGKVTIKKTRFSTPCASFLRPYKTLTLRGSRVLCNDVKFNILNNTPDNIMNPRFSEWLMGLPRDYTSLR